MARRSGSAYSSYNVTCQYVGDAIRVGLPREPFVGSSVLDSIYRNVKSQHIRYEPSQKACYVSASEIDSLAAALYDSTRSFPSMSRAKRFDTGDTVMLAAVVTGIAQQVVYDGERKLFVLIHNEREYPYELIADSEIVFNYWKGKATPSTASNVYEVLGVSQTDEESVVKRAYKQLCIKWHPDRNKEPDARKQFDAIQEAYSIVSNPRRRAMYNAGLKQEMVLAQRSRAEQFPAITSGHVLLHARMILGRLIVSTIIEWRPL